jgi:hypothetical protein
MSRVFVSILPSYVFGLARAGMASKRLLTLSWLVSA